MTFLDVLSLDPALCDHLTSELETTAASALATGNAGVLTLSLKIVPTGSEEVHIEPICRRKQPHRTARILTLPTKNGKLARPKQGSLFRSEP